MFKTILKIIFFTLLVATILIITIQSFYEKLSDLELIITTAISTLIGAFLGVKSKGKYISTSVGITTIWVLFFFAILMIAYGIFDAIFIYREGMKEMLPFVIMIAAIAPLFMALIVNFFIRKEDGSAKIAQLTIIDNTPKSYQFIGRKTGNTFIVILAICSAIILGYSVILLTILADILGGIGGFAIFWLTIIFATPLALIGLVTIFKQK